MRAIAGMEGDMMESDAVLRSIKDQSLLRSFALGLSAPALLVSGPQIDVRTLRRGESIDHAWASVGSSLSRNMTRISYERWTGRRTA